MFELCASYARSKLPAGSKYHRPMITLEDQLYRKEHPITIDNRNYFDFDPSN
jgi:hypothetical protein